MRIRRANRDDRTSLLDVWLRSVRATHEFLSEAEIQGLLPSVREYLASDATEFWVAESDAGAALGFMGLGAREIESLFLAPEVLRRGYGRQLVLHARELRGELTVEVNEQNAGACRFYERCGFVVTGRSATDSAGRPYPLLHMRLAAPTT